MPKKKKLHEMSDAELRARKAVLENKAALKARSVAKNNAEVLKQIQRLRGGSGGGGGVGIFGTDQIR